MQWQFLFHGRGFFVFCFLTQIFYVLNWLILFKKINVEFLDDSTIFLGHFFFIWKERTFCLFHHLLAAILTSKNLAVNSLLHRLQNEVGVASTYMEIPALFNFNCLEDWKCQQVIVIWSYMVNSIKFYKNFFYEHYWLFK